MTNQRDAGSESCVLDKTLCWEQLGTNTPFAWVWHGNVSLKERYDPHNTVGYRERERERERNAC